MGSIDDPNVEELLASALVDSKEIPQMERQMPYVLTYLRNQWLTQQIREAGQQMDDPDMDPTQLIIIMKRRQDLERMKRQAIKLPEMD